MRCRANGLMYVVFSSHWTPMKNGKYDYTVRFSIPHSTLVLREQDQSCCHEVWMHLALANPRGAYTPHDKDDQRQHLKGRSSPYELNKERSRAHREQSDHSHTSEVIHVTTIRKVRTTCTPRPSFNDLMRHRHPFFFFLLLFSNSCHTLHLRHICMSHCTRSYAS